MSLTRMNHTDDFELFYQIEQEAAAVAFGQELLERGFTAFRVFLDRFRDFLKLGADEELSAAVRLLQRSRTAIPNPGAVSPSWVNVWQEYESIIRYKTEVLNRIPVKEREGEWQVLIDNPYTHQDIAVYPGLTFLDAAYLYAYFRVDLEHNEFVRLQKIETLIFHQGE